MDLPAVFACNINVDVEGAGFMPPAGCQWVSSGSAAHLFKNPPIFVFVGSVQGLFFFLFPGFIRGGHVTHKTRDQDSCVEIS